jgi:hypothetical protein
MFKSVDVKRPILIFLDRKATVLTLASRSSAQQPDKSETLKKARRSYYSLKDEASPNFNAPWPPTRFFFSQSNAKPIPPASMPRSENSKPLHFGLSLSLDGNAKVQIASGLKQVYRGMEQMAF